MDEIFRVIQPVIAEHLGVDPCEVTMEASLVNDLGADSLEVVELCMEYEKNFDISLPDDASETIITVGDAVRLIKKMRTGDNESAGNFYRQMGKDIVEAPNHGEKPGATSTMPVGKTPLSTEHGATQHHLDSPKVGKPTTGNGDGGQSQTIFSGNILHAKLELVLCHPAFKLTVAEMLKTVGGLDALNRPVNEVIKEYLTKAKYPEK